MSFGIVLVEVIKMYANKAEEMVDFVELLRCQSYDQVFELKKKIGEERFGELEAMYERLKSEDDVNVTGSSVEISEQEKMIDLSRLENVEVELTDILKMMLCTSTSELRSLHLSSKNYYVVETYQAIYEYLKENPGQVPIVVTIKVSSLLK